MTDAELDRLAAVIADAVKRARPTAARSAPDSGTASPAPWLPAPVRTELSTRGGVPAPWTGAAQTLGDVAPIRHPSAPEHRATTAEMTRLTRAAAAGKGPERSAPETVPVPPRKGGRAGPAVNARRRQAQFPLEVKVGVSNRHVHLSPAHVAALFGNAGLSEFRPLRQPGQFAANESIVVVGAKGRIESLRVVGPVRDETQLELSYADAAVLGIAPPVASSGTLLDSIGGVTLIGPYGRVELARGVIIAARHLHCAPADAARWGLVDGDRLDVRVGDGARRITLHQVLVRTGPAHATELHLDVDEARAAGVATGDSATVTGWRAGGAGSRRLITERDVIAIARAKSVLPRGALLTPSARDRARHLGLLPHE